MIDVSNDFKIAMKQPVKEIRAYISSATQTIASENDLISFKVSCDSGMCKSAMRKLEAKYLGEHNLLGEWLNVGFGVRLADNTFEYLDYGTFLVTEITTTKDTGVTEIVAYDKMVETMKPYEVLDVTYPITLYEYTKKLCSICGLELGNTTLINGTWNITEELWKNIDGITYRDILVQIAQATASTCIIGADNKVYFKYITNTGEQLTYDNMRKLKLEPMYGEINSVVLSRTPQEDNIYERDEESIKTNGLTEFKIENNEIVDKNRDTAIIPIYNMLKGISYYPFETTTEGLGWYEIGDQVNIINDTGDAFKCVLFNFSISVDGGIKEILKATAETKTQTQYQYATPIGKRVKNTEIIVNKQEQYINQLVTDMYEENGIIHENFTNVYQDINNIINSVQNSGGNNLIKNSVMFAYDNNTPKDWHVENASKNICFNDWELGHYDYETGEKASNNARARLTELLAVSPNTTYYLNSNIGENFVIRGYDINKNFIHSFGGVGITTTLKTPDNCYYLGVGLYSADTTNYGNTILEKLKSATTLPYISLANNQSYNYTPYIEGGLIIQTSAEALSNGGLSGHSFTLLDKKVSQKIMVSTSNFYSFSTRIKKETTGTCYIRLYNSKEEHTIQLASGESAFYNEYEIKAILPKDNYYIIEFYGSSDSNATFTDNMLAMGEYKTQWQQASGEIMNTQVNINLDGVLVKSSIYLGDYTVMSPLEFAGYSKINGTITKVFSLNKDITLVKKLEAEDEVKMLPIKIVPVTSGDLQGWAFVPST